MTQMAELSFGIASEEWEFEQIHRLNYQAFVLEIPQHPPNSDGIMVDRFHPENTYIVCRSGDRILASIAVRAKRPFSLDQKLENLESYLPNHRAVCELRLLSVEKPYRNSRVFKGLLQHVCDYCEGRGYDLAIISGTVRQLKLYRQMGFLPFGPLVGTKEASFQPMYLTLQAYQDLTKQFRIFRHRAPATQTIQKPIDLMPGPVAISSQVREAFAASPVSHRSKAFIQDFQKTKDLLCRFVAARYCEIMPGSGTVANDAIAAQLSLQPGMGLVLSNGEFGNRLIDHAERFRLKFRTYRAQWGRTFDTDALRTLVEEDGDISWLWAVHCETSSGILNDLKLLEKLCAKRGIPLCLDCVSSIGTVPVNVSNAYLASCVSGKGLGSYPGLAIVFYNHEIQPASHGLPRYLDLSLYASCNGIPFSISSNLVYALKIALESFSVDRFRAIQEISRRLRAELKQAGFQLVGGEVKTSPAVTTIALREGLSSEWVGRKLSEAGYLLSYSSGYLKARNWIQICLMGEVGSESLSPLIALMERLCSAAVSRKSAINPGKKAIASTS